MVEHRVKDGEGHDVTVVTTEDVLALERSLRRWIIGSVVGGFGIAFAIGVWVATIEQRVTRSEKDIADVIREGSKPMNALTTQIALLQSSLSTFTASLGRMESAIANCETRQDSLEQTLLRLKVR